MGSSKRAKRRRKRDRPPPLVRGPLGMMRPFVDAVGRNFSVPLWARGDGPAALPRAEWREMENALITNFRMMNIRVPPMDPRTRKRMDYLRALQAEMADREAIGMATVNMDGIRSYPPLPIVHQEFRMPVRNFHEQEARVDLRAIQERARRLAAAQEAATLRALQHSAPFVIHDVPETDGEK